MLATPHPNPHPHLHSLEPVEAPHALLVDHPGLPAEQHPDPQESELRLVVRQLLDAESQRRLVLYLARYVQRCPAEQGEGARPHHGNFDRVMIPADQRPPPAGAQTPF